jgi:hypothetical protein
MNWGSPPGGTNKIEAHLYFGVIPFYLLVLGGAWGALRGHRPGRKVLLWAAMGLAAVIIATGWPILLLRHVPGFSFFAGPGRYGIITTLAVALGAGGILDRLLARIRLTPLKAVILSLIFAGTVYDLWLVSHWVTNVVMVSEPPVDFRNQSTFGQRIAFDGPAARVFAPGPNLPTMTGVNCVPEYLGIGPSAYFDPQRAFPRGAGGEADPELVRRQVEWLQEAGVSHVLSFSTLDRQLWPVAPRETLFDPFLNRAWARGREPLYLYRLSEHRPRVFFENEPAGARAEVMRIGPNDVEIDVDSPSGGRLILKDLSYPGWEATIDGEPAPPAENDETSRAVDVPPGPHRVVWSFAPASFRLGLWVTVLAAALLGAWIAIARRRSPTRSAA